jgi:hypothetical protein
LGQPGIHVGIFGGPTPRPREYKGLSDVVEAWAGEIEAVQSPGKLIPVTEAQLKAILRAPAPVLRLQNPSSGAKRGSEGA